jgi:hypothetical protein
VWVKEHATGQTSEAIGEVAPRNEWRAEFVFYLEKAHFGHPGHLELGKEITH